MSELGRKFAELKSGAEPLRTKAAPLPITLLDFWRWSGSDLLTNTARGVLAEFIVATATGCDVRKPRQAWDKFDLTTQDDIKLEVKSSAFLQSWGQNESGLSKISFSIKESLPFDADTNKQGKQKERTAEVYVFCLLHHKNKDTVDPIDLDQWTFFVLSIRDLERYRRSRHSITLRSLQNIAKELTYEKVGDEVRAAHARP